MEKLWLLDIEWVGPRRFDLGEREHFIRVLDSAPRKNMSCQQIDESAGWQWLGTTDSWNRYGLGALTQAQAQQIIASEIGHTVNLNDVTPGKEFFYKGR